MLPLDLSTHSGVSKNDPFGPVPANPPGIILEDFPEKLFFSTVFGSASVILLSISQSK